MFKKKAFIHWYTGEGMEEMDFTNARNNVLDVCNEYMEAGNDCGDYDDSYTEKCPICTECSEARCVCECRIKI